MDTHSIKPLQVEELEDAISKASGIKVATIFSKDRGPEVVDARHAIWYVCHEHMGFSFSRIGCMYDKDHTTIMSAVKRIRDDEDKQALITDGLNRVNPALLTELPNAGGGVSAWRW